MRTRMLWCLSMVAIAALAPACKKAAETEQREAEKAAAEAQQKSQESADEASKKAREAAQKADLRVGDRVLAAQDQEPVTEVELRAILAASPDIPVRLEIDREGEVLDLTVRPRDVEGSGRIGVSFTNNLPRLRLSAVEAIPEAFRVNLQSP